MRMTRVLQPAFVALAAFAMAQDGTVLRRELKEGAVDQYKVEFLSKQTVDTGQGGGTQQFDVGGSLTYATKIGKFDPDKKLSDLEITISNMKFDLQGMAAMMQGMMDQLPKEVKLTGKIDDHNRMTAIKPDPKMAQASAMVQMFVGGWSEFTAFPDQAVKVGDTWDVTVPKLPQYGNKEFKLKAKCTAEKTVGTAAAIVIAVDGVLPMDMDMSALMGAAGGPEQASQGAHLVGPLDFHMDLTLEKATGRLLEMSSKSSGKQKMEMPSMGVSADVDGLTTTTIKPLPPGSAPDKPGGI